MNVHSPLLERDADHIYRWKGQIAGPSITQMLALCGVTDYSFLTEEHTLKGRAVHRGIELLELGRLRWDTVDDVVKPYIDGYQNFKAHTGFVPFKRFIEWAFYHPFLRYPGQIDIFGTIGDQLILPDFKSGTLEWWVGLQTWLQEQGIRACGTEALTAEGVSLEGQKIKRFALQLKPNGKLKYNLEPFHDDAHDSRLALAVVSLCQKQLQHGGDRWLRRLNKQTHPSPFNR